MGDVFVRNNSREAVDQATSLDVLVVAGNKFALVHFENDEVGTETEDPRGSGAGVAMGSLGRIGFLRGLLGFWPAETKGAAMAALARVGVAEYAGQRAGTLSGGQQQRGAIARALVQGARAIVADEPVASLDPVSARKVMELLVELNSRDGLGVIVTLHQVDYAMRYCDRVIALKAGKVVYDGPPNGLTRKQLIDIYGPEFEDAFWETKV